MSNQSENQQSGFKPAPIKTHVLDGTLRFKRAQPRCPICGTPTPNRSTSFCSKRCRDIDLGHWITGNYHVSLDASEHSFVANDDEL